MTLVIPNAYEQSIVKLLIDVTALGGGWHLRLYTNDVTAGLTAEEIDELEASDFTEATFDGYSAITVTNANWTYQQANPTVATDIPRSFVRTSDGTPEVVYGYYLTEVSDGDLAWFEQFPGPITIEFEDDEVVVTPRLTLDDVRGNDVQPGTITMWGGNVPPDGWLICDGSAVSRTTYSELFALIGTAYGAGNGTTTFNLPDLRQRFPMGQSSSGTGSTIGETGGAIDHTHNLDTPSAYAKHSWSGTTGWQQRNSVPSHSTNIIHTVSGSAVSVTDRTFGAALGGDTDTANPPYTVVSFIIKV